MLNSWELPGSSLVTINNNNNNNLQRKPGSRSLALSLEALALAQLFHEPPPN